MRPTVLVLVLAGVVATWIAPAAHAQTPACDALQQGQFVCAALAVDPSTGGNPGCLPSRTATVNCSVFEGVLCAGPAEFNATVPCRYTGDTQLSKALSLSVFLGIFGADRFYLGYPTVGFLKLITVGFFLMGYYADIFLIGTQLLLPADGTDYVVPYTGPILTQVASTNTTYRVPLS